MMKHVRDLSPEEARAWRDQPDSESEIAWRIKAWQEDQFLVYRSSDEEDCVRENILMNAE